MALRDLRIHACEKGGFIVYGPHQEAEAFMRNEPVKPLAAFQHLDDMIAFVRSEMAPASDPHPPDRTGISRQ